jgi:hypothetical protein
MWFGDIPILVLPFISGRPVRDNDGVGTADGILTIGLEASTPGIAMRDMTDSAGDRSPSRMVEPPSDDFRLIATLGVYTLPYMLGRRLPWKLPLPRPRPYCWLGRRARGMKMKDLSVLGNMYRGASSGMEILTGLSRLKGGRCCGRRVCCLLTTLETNFLCSIPGSETCTVTFPRTVTKEKDLFGPLGAGGLSFFPSCESARIFVVLGSGFGAASCRSCRSCAQGLSVGSFTPIPRLWDVSNRVPCPMIPNVRTLPVSPNCTRAHVHGLVV